MGDEAFLKLYICTKLKWNPASEEVKNIPDYQWMLLQYMVEAQLFDTWDRIAEPQAELIGMISNPQAFDSYSKYKNTKTTKYGETVVKTKDGQSGQTIANSMFDPVKGLVNEKGEVLVDAETLKKNNPHFRDMMVST